MVGVDGRVRVMDFGLARGRGREGREPVQHPALTSSSIDAFSLELTRVGAVMGTPAYMSPEQFDGVATTEAADQFSYCAALWELLYNQRPFAGETLGALASAVRSGQLVTPPGGAPSWLRRVCERGLRPNPRDRFPSLEALLDALASGQRSARNRRGLVALGVLATIAGGAVGAERVEAARTVAACEAAGDAIDSTWHDDARARVREALLATGVGFATDTAERVLPWLDAHAHAWSNARVESCLDTNVRGVWSEDTHERSQWCLDERRMEFDALVDTFSYADAGVARRAVLGAANLPRIEPCRDPAALERLGAPPEDRREDVRAVLELRARVAALRLSGDYAGALSDAETALTRAEAIAWPPLIAELRTRVGALQGKLGSYDTAEATLRQAYFEAAQSDAHTTAADAASRLVYTVGYRKAQFDQGLLWARLAEVELTRAGATDELRRGELHNSLGSLYFGQGDHERAMAEFQRGLEHNQGALGPDHPALANRLNNLATAVMTTGAYEDAKELITRAVALQEETLGPEHPEVATTLANLGNAEIKLANLDAATNVLTRALQIRERAMGTEHASVAALLGNLSVVHSMKGDDGAAKTMMTRTVAIYEKARGPDHPTVATALGNLTRVLVSLEHLDQALTAGERSLQINERVFGAEHKAVANSLVILGQVHENRRAYEDAKAMYERALAIDERLLGPDHADSATVTQSLASLALAQGRPDDAKSYIRRTLQILDASDANPLRHATAQFILAQALWETPDDRPRARALAREVVKTLKDHDALADTRADVEAWVREREVTPRSSP